MILTTLPKILKTAQWYRKNKFVFTCTYSHTRVRIDSPHGSYTSNNSLFPAGELNFIKQVKGHILKSGGHLKVKQDCKQDHLVKEPVYYHYGKSLKDSEYIPDIYCIDIKSAYWQTAYGLGLITDAMYKKGNEVSKKTRLAAIGSLAKKTTTYSFDGKEQKLISKNYEETEFLWNIICNIVGDVLMDASSAAGEDFLFFWVDGIFIKEGAIDAVTNVFIKSGYEFSVKKLPGMLVRRKAIYVVEDTEKLRTIDGVKKMTNIKPFPFSNKKKTP